MLRRRLRSKMRDVLGVLGRARVGQAAQAPRLHLGDEVAQGRDERPALAAQIGQVEPQRLADVVVEDLGGLPQVARRGGAGHQRAGGEQPGKLRWAHADERRAEVRRQDVVAGEDPDLRPLGRIGRGKAHAAAPEQDNGRRPFGNLGNECLSARHLERQVGGRHREVAHLELAVRVQRQPVEAADDGQLLHQRDPGVGPGRDIDTPGGDGRLAAELGEHLEQQPDRPRP